MRELAIAIPSNILEDCQSLSDKTSKIGLIARAISIFKVTKIHVYKNKGRSDNEFILLLLRYLVTPQYLRKNLFPISLTTLAKEKYLWKEYSNYWSRRIDWF